MSQQSPRRDPSGDQPSESATAADSQLTEVLRSATDRASKPAPLLDALAALDPNAALAWLEGQGAARADDASLALAVSRVLGSRAGDPARALAVALHWANTAAPDTLLEVVRRAAKHGDAEELAAVVQRGLASHPRHVGLLRESAQQAAQDSDPGRAHALYARLARADGGQATALRVMRSRAKLGPSGDPPVRVALLSSFTIDALVPFVDLELRDLALAPEFYVAPFDTWAREVLDPAGGLRRFDPQIAFLSVSIDDLVPALSGLADADTLATSGGQALERVLGAAQAFSGWSEAPLVVHAFHSAYAGPLGILEGRAGPSRSRWLGDLNGQLADGLAALPRAYLLDLPDVLLRRDEGPVDNPKMRHLAAMHLTERAAAAVARAYAGYVAPLAGRTRKCIVLDLDNTLWGGTVGEDGFHGIKLGDTSPGIEFREFQQFLLGLTQAGFLLAINSKNNPDDALEVIRNHDAMILREEHFSAMRINWEPKPENLRSIAEELNIGIDSMIFLDDNPNERERVRQFAPQVLVPELPADPALYRKCVEALPQIQRLVATDEDQQRVEMYRSRKQREGAREQAGSVDDYLKSLEIVVEIEPAGEAGLPRVHQLFQRTNQFNLTTRRYEASELADFAARSDRWLGVLRARDRFGDHGLVAVALVRREDDTWVVDSFLMSCRVIGYGVETALLAVVAEHARAAGARVLAGEYAKTAKNEPARDFYPRHGFAEPEPGADGVLVFRRSLDQAGPERPAWLQVVLQDEAGSTG